MKWSLDIYPGWLPDNKKTLQLCRESFSFLYGFIFSEFDEEDIEKNERGYVSRYILDQDGESV
jgi:hypothetical protein